MKRHGAVRCFVVSGGPTTYPEIIYHPMRAKNPAISRSRDRDPRDAEMPDVAKHRQIEIGKCLAKPICPGIGKQRVVLGPAHAGRHLDRRRRRRFAFHHPDAAGMRRAVMRKAAGEVSGF